MLLGWGAGAIGVGAYFFLTPYLSPPAEPGNISSPTLAKLLNESIDAAIARMNPTHSPGLIPEAAANSRAFLKEVSEVVARCSKGRFEPNQKYNKLEYHLLRVDGVRYEPIYTGLRCHNETLIYRAVFKDGRVAEAFTDGSERQYPVGQVRGAVGEFGKKVTWSDRDYHPARYYVPPPAQPTQKDIAKQWE
ncbi:MULTISPECIES: hypothetical protein [Myxococcus]|uniref:hypothetical protein n=1 Tax=Myxococcus TaxID=32 RepID=UPI001144CF83|nr:MULTISPECIES: hypothetical protein [Myxococcus]NOK06123.1 hypothetical protein [Myxococcus xanthus]